MSGAIVFPTPKRPELEQAAQRKIWREKKARYRKRKRDRDRQGF
jgi:hypothetical protein